MNIGLYQSAASLSALERWQDAVAQNITSGQVAGYRKRTVEFSGQMGGQWQLDPSGKGGSDTTVSAIFPKATTQINFLGGDTSPTGRDMDMAIQGEGFFTIQAPDGSLAYTRSGAFSVRADRTVTAAGGAEVLSDSGSPIVLSPTGGTVTVSPEGKISQNGVPLGRFGVQKFANQADLVPVGGGMFVPTNGATPEPMEKPEVLQGYLENSNVTPMREMVDLVLISRSYEANQKVITAADQQMQKTLDALG
jgi:flagellar basal-body rod protein FlgF